MKHPPLPPNCEPWLNLPDSWPYPPAIVAAICEVAWRKEAEKLLSKAQLDTAPDGFTWGWHRACAEQNIDAWRAYGESK